MIRPVGIETEYGMNCVGFSEEIDFGYEASMLVRAAAVEGAFRGWDYSREDPYWDLRGIRAE
ncbi:MAG TPA: peptidase, partial [Chloroflexota bacterium]|nr:peptidase [Chloroflexota bacterium]HJO08117.1 peptidase [Chloroflexota bacterium]